MQQPIPRAAKGLKRSGAFALAAAGFDAIMAVVDIFSRTWLWVVVLSLCCVVLTLLGTWNLRQYRRMVAR